MSELDSSEITAADSSDDEAYNPTKIAGKNVWEPEPQTIVELYEKLDKDGIIELNWKHPGKVASQVEESQHVSETVQETPEEVIRMRERQQLVSMFEDEDMNTKMNTPTTLSKTPKAPPKGSNKAKASFDRIFNKVSLQTPTGQGTPHGTAPDQT